MMQFRARAPGRGVLKKPNAMAPSMEQITREQAEKYFIDSQVLKTNVDQSPTELRILISLSDKNSVLVTYNLHNHKKAFFSESPLQNTLLK